MMRFWEKLGDDAPTVTFKLDPLTVALLMASILYTFCLVLAKRKISTLHRIRPEMSTRMLLVLSVALVCAVRVMTILGVAAMNNANVRAHYSLQPTTYHSPTHEDTHDKNQGFYDKAMTVLFDLPNCMVVSSYVLLTLVWAECFLESRFHTESVVQWKKTWLIGYMIFNSALYATQLILYTCIFFAHKNNVVRTILYAAITGINFGSVLLVLLLYLYLNVRFSVSLTEKQKDDLFVIRACLFHSQCFVFNIDRAFHFDRNNRVDRCNESRAS